MKLFFDNDLAPRLARAIAALEGDHRISRNRLEVEAWKEAGLVVFFLRKSRLSLTFWDQAWQLVKQWPKIKSEATQARPGQGFLVPLRGTHFEPA